MKSFKEFLIEGTTNGASIKKLAKFLVSKKRQNFEWNNTTLEEFLTDISKGYYRSEKGEKVGFIKPFFVREAKKAIQEYTDNEWDKLLNMVKGK